METNYNNQGLPTLALNTETVRILTERGPKEFLPITITWSCHTPLTDCCIVINSAGGGKTCV